MAAETRAHRKRDGARAVMPLAIAVGGFGISFGVLAQAAGMGPLAPVVMSLTTFAGSAQLAAVSVLSAGGALTAAIAAAILLNLRYLPIGISVAPEFHGPMWRRLLQAQLIVDESWAIGHVGAGRYDRKLLLGAGLGIYIAWNAGTVIGVIGGEALGDPKELGLDAAFPALFLGLLVTQVRHRTALVASLLGAAIAIALVPLAPAGVPIVAASAATLIGLRRPR
jgi:4-azaleucine resistance transporter AzlC